MIRDNRRLRTAFSTRQYMISRDFELYYYSDINLNPVTPHAHDYYEFYFFLQGDISLTVEGVPMRIQPGDFLLIPPGISHFPTICDPSVPYRRFVLWISQDYCTRLMETSITFGYLMQHVITARKYSFHTDVFDFNTIQTRLFSIIEEIRGNRFGKEAEVALQVNSLILYLNRLVYDRLHPASCRDNTLFENLMLHISENLGDDLSLEALSRKFYVSKFHIAHLFKDTLGVSVHQYILKKRLEACRCAILGSTPIGQLCLQYGFSDYSSFYRAFRKQFGVSPKEYRLMHLTEEDIQ